MALQKKRTNFWSCLKFKIKDESFLSIERVINENIKLEQKKKKKLNINLVVPEWSWRTR